MKTIRMIVILVILALGCTLQAKAQSATSFDYTGNNAVLHYSPYQPLTDNWIGVSGSSGGVGGPSLDILDGVASQFTITDTTSITALDVDAQIIDLEPYGTTTLSYGIYSGTLPYGSGFIPDKNSGVLVSGSEPLVFQGTPATENITVPFDVTLQPGTYWIEDEGSGFPDVITTQTYISSSIAPVPEPPTFLLFGLGMILFVIGTYFYQIRASVFFSQIDSLKVR